MENAPSSRQSYLPWLIEFPFRLIAKMLYHVRSLGGEKVPAQGGALLLANHLSYVDVIVLQLACPRRIRFVGHEGLTGSGIMKWALKMSGTILISPHSSLEGTRRIIRALNEGDLVCVFPEGGISRTGQLMEVKRGFELMAQKANVPIVPAFHDGLWGSIFSFSDNAFFWKWPRFKSLSVCVCFGDPIPPQEANVNRVRRDLLDLGAQAFNERPVLKSHLGREIVKALAKRPSHVEVIDRTAARKAVTAAQLLGVASALSRHLKARVKSKRVGIVLPPSAGATIANIAVVLAGKVPVNLNYTSGRSSLETSMRLGEISTVISAETVKRELAKRAPDFPWPDDMIDLGKELAALGKIRILGWVILAWIMPHQLMPALLGLPRVGDQEEAGLLFTSGSSGEPKGVALSHRNIIGNCLQVASLPIIPESAILLGCLPLFHCFGFTVTIWYPLLRGCKIATVPSPLDTRKIVDTIREEEATHLIGAPTFLRPILRRAEEGELRSLTFIVSGAEKMPLDLYEAFFDRFHVEIMQGYGLTETTPVSNVNQLNPPVPNGLADVQAGQRLGSVGRMLPGMTARIVNPDTMKELPLTETGVLLFRGANIFSGYLKDEVKTKNAFHNGWFVTGDLARFDEEGFLFIEGRLSRFSKIGGEMVPHGTIEQKIVDAFAWKEELPVVVVVGVPDAAKGEALILLSTKEITAEELRDKLGALGLPNLWVPKIIHRVEKIPLLGTGKLDLKGSRDLALSLVAKT